jgi:polyhydroxybutyrate depolymerase
MRRRRIVWAVCAAAVVTTSGCRAAPASATGTRTGTITVGGLARTYLLHVPQHLASKPALVVNLHGGGGTAAGQEQLSGFDAVADREGFLVVYPQGYDKGWADGRGTNTAEKHGVDDVEFVKALLDRLEPEYSVDESAVFATGFSNGGFMTQRLGCDLADRFAAVAPVAGTLGTQVTCHPSRPVSVLEIHGTADPVVPYDGGRMTIERGGASTIVSAPAMVERWRAIDGCHTQPTRSDIDTADDGTAVTAMTSSPCTDGTAVAFYSVAGAGHTWPGGHQYLPTALVGRTSQDVVASDVIWTFFSSHHRR